MMEHSIYSRHKGLLSTILISAASLYGLANSTPASASDFVPEMCMAEAYMEVNNLNSLPQDKLNCTAEDVQIAEIFNESIDECTPGEVVEFTASVTIVTNANERYDTTFYNSLTGIAPNFVQPDTGESIELPNDPDTSYPYLCSLLIPDASAADNFVFADLDLDACGDITKANGVDTYTLDDQTITMLCEDVDNDDKADFSYCAAWDNQSRDNCTLDRDPVRGQVPNTKSKCNCDVLTTNIFIKPEPPEMTKTLIGDAAADEPSGVFKYQVSIKNVSTKSDITINAVEDIVRSPTDSGVFANFDLSTSTNTTVGNLTLLAQHVDHTCDEAFSGLPLTLTPTSTTVTCVIVVQINDDDLPNDQSDELYQDFVRATVVDKNGSAVGDNTCDPTHPTTPTDPSNGTCTNVVEVAMQDVGVSITIDKFVYFPSPNPDVSCTGSVDADGKCDGSVWIKEPGGDVTYKLIFENTSEVDTLTIDILTDTVSSTAINLLSAISGNTCDSMDLDLNVDEVDSCMFVRNVSGDVNAGITNTAYVHAIEKSDQSEGNSTFDDDTALVTIMNVAPAVLFDKKVRTDDGSEPNDPNDYFETVELNEPGGNVTYRFEITNISPSGEDITLIDFEDTILETSPRVTLGTSTCNFSTTVISYGAANSYVCYIDAAVTGEPNNDLVNSARVKITDGEEELYSLYNDATVTFADVGPQLTLDFAYTAVVFANIDTRGVGAFEDLTIDALRIRNVDIPPEGSEDDTSDASMRLLNLSDTRTRDGLGFNACEVGDIVAADTQKLCYFVIQLLPIFDDVDFKALKSGLGPVEIILSDPEGNSVKFEAEVDLTTTAYGPL
ncbi:hypothetical protein [Vibrio natriegens]|uniref:hypothetical protein n=1 Tax=Vibrio natriegens TaxID=691 RepID=UPI00390A9670